MSGLIGKKLGMSRVFDDRGESVPVTIIETGPCFVTAIRTLEKNGYEALQLGYGDLPEKRTTKPLLGQFDKIQIKPLRFLKEFRTFADISKFKEGDQLKADLFAAGDRVKVTGISKGKGFQGVVKRHGFSGGPKTHGQSDRWRAPGSLGQSSYPSRVYKGLRMAGKMGKDRVTVKNIEVVRVDVENNIIMVRGAVPGAANAIVLITK